MKKPKRKRITMEPLYPATGFEEPPLSVELVEEDKEPVKMTVVEPPLVSLWHEVEDLKRLIQTEIAKDDAQRALEKEVLLKINRYLDGHT